MHGATRAWHAGPDDYRQWFKKGWHEMHGFGRRFGMGPERFFGRGDIKFLLLELLLERPKHGYEMIKELEGRFSGFYSPSPGSVYPTLQMLEDRGYVRSTSEDGKRVYSITEEGRTYLQAQGHERPSRRWHQPEFGASPELRAFGREVFEFGRAVVQAARSSSHDPERMARLRGVIDRARREIYAILSESGTPSTSETPPTTSV